MTQNKSNHLPPEQSKKLPIHIDTEYVWIRINKKWELSSYKSLDAYIKLGMSNKLLPAPTLEEMLRSCPKFINAEQYDYDHSIILSMEFFNGEFGLGYPGVQFLYHKDPKQAVDQMLHWLFKNDYLKELTNAK